MPHLNEIRTSLEVGFADGALPEQLARFRGRQTRSIGNCPSYPFEDAQFDVVLMEEKVVSLKSVREAHRVLKPDGRLFFVVPERTKKQAGFTLPEIYSLVRNGFNIVEVVRPPWWLFGLRGRTITICAQKKNWRNHTNTYRPYL